MVAIAETWANSAYIESELSFPGYESFRKNRKHKKGGAVICYVKSTLPAVKIDKQDTESYDSVYVEITANNKKLILATVYGPPKQQAADDIALYQELHSLTQSKEAIITGDFICPNIEWRQLTGDHEGNGFIEMVENSFLTHVVTQPTRENNLLDLVLESDPDLIRDCEVGEKNNG